MFVDLQKFQNDFTDIKWLLSKRETTSVDLQKFQDNKSWCFTDRVTSVQKRNDVCWLAKISEQKSWCLTDRVTSVQKRTDVCWLWNFNSRAGSFLSRVWWVKFEKEACDCPFGHSIGMSFCLSHFFTDHEPQYWVLFARRSHGMSDFAVLGSRCGQDLDQKPQGNVSSIGEIPDGCAKLAKFQRFAALASTK